MITAILHHSKNDPVISDASAWQNKKNPGSSLTANLTDTRAN